MYDKEIENAQDEWLSMMVIVQFVKKTYLLGIEKV
jgi:hypothetical protein